MWQKLLWHVCCFSWLLTNIWSKTWYLWKQNCEGGCSNYTNQLFSHYTQTVWGNVCPHGECYSLRGMTESMLINGCLVLFSLVNYWTFTVMQLHKEKKGCIAWIQNLKWNQNIVEAVSPTHTLDLCILMPAQVYSVTHFTLVSFFFLSERKMPFAID